MQDTYARNGDGEGGSTPFRERRESIRTSKDWNCLLTDAKGRCISALPANISAHGVYLWCHSHFPLSELNSNNAVSLQIHVNGESYILHCDITRVAKDGVALAYSKHNPRQTLNQLACHLYGDYQQLKNSGDTHIRIVLESISRSWGQQIAVDDISTTFSTGETVALVGPSGGGKSTLIRLIAGVTRPSSGRILVNHRNLDNLSMRDLRAHRAMCGIVQQNHLLVPQLSVHQNVITGLIARWPFLKVAYSSMWPVEKKRVAELLKMLGIEDHQWQVSSTLSGGQQQRVAVARAIIGNPRIILADEPTSSLDPNTAQETTQLIIDYAKRENALLVFCTHHLDIVKAYCDRIIGLRQGKCIFDVKSGQLTENMMDKLYAGSRERI